MITFIYFLFFAFSIIFVFYELYVISETRNILDKVAAFKKFKEDIKTANENGETPNLKAPFSLVGITIMQFLYFIWLFFALFTDQWVVAVFILLSSFIPATKLGVFFMKLDAILSLSCLLFMIFNHYHFNIDLFQVIKQNW